MTKYKVIIYWSEEDQSYIAEVPELVGCKADGSSYQEAVSNAERVIAEWIETAIEQGRYISEPKGRRLFTHCCAIARKHPLVVVICIMLVVFSFYFANFSYGFSDTKGDWGTFGDYVGGILNPVIASFAFYLIAKTYELQKRELKLSTKALNDQVKLGAFTALLNSNLTRISLLKNENLEILKENGRKSNDGPKSGSNDLDEDFLSGFDAEEFEKEIRKNLTVINELTEKNKDFENQIGILCNQFN